MSQAVYPAEVEKWGVFELSMPGKSDGNPFTDYTIEGVFRCEEECVKVDGFYDGEGIYRVRFMPSFERSYTFRVSGSFSDEAVEGSFQAIAPGAGNHGPVRVANTYHFAYEDGTPYYSVGTTCYVWTHQSEALQKQTLASLKASPFNKIRFCIMPKHYDYNLNEPLTYPYEGTPMDHTVLNKENFNQYTEHISAENHWDFTRFNPVHFQLFEQRIGDLMKLGIEADLILLHPYDRWGFAHMPAECDDLYIKYVIARFAAYRNVWWSLANEYDLMRDKSLADWERIAALICAKDPYHHLRSIHNNVSFYDYSRPWITHCSIQRIDVHKTAEFTAEWRQRYQKPVVLDEITYEGNINHCWGNISAKELVRRFWEATIRGGYAGHGETYMHPDDILWWSHGGKLHGESPARFAFLYQILCQTPALGLKPGTPENWDDFVAVPEDTAADEHRYRLYYFGNFRPSFRQYCFDQTHRYRAEVIDTWEMTITDAGTFRGKFQVDLPGKEYMAVRITRVE